MAPSDETSHHIPESAGDYMWHATGSDGRERGAIIVCTPMHCQALRIQGRRRAVSESVDIDGAALCDLHSPLWRYWTTWRFLLGASALRRVGLRHGGDRIWMMCT